MNSRKLKSAVALALMATLVGNQATLAMNGNKSVSNSFSSKTGCLSEKSASIFDKILGVKLASKNQFAEKIS